MLDWIAMGIISDMKMIWDEILNGVLWRRDFLMKILNFSKITKLADFNLCLIKKYLTN